MRTVLGPITNVLAADPGLVGVTDQVGQHLSQAHGINPTCRIAFMRDFKTPIRVDDLNLIRDFLAERGYVGFCLCNPDLSTERRAGEIEQIVKSASPTLPPS